MQLKIVNFFKLFPGCFFYFNITFLMQLILLIIQECIKYNYVVQVNQRITILKYQKINLRREREKKSMSLMLNKIEKPQPWQD